MEYSVQYGLMVWDIWWKLTGTGPIKGDPECSHYKGIDQGGRGLCSHPENSGSVPQERNCLRCNILCCPSGEKIQKSVSAILKKRMKEKEDERLVELDKEEASRLQNLPVIPVAAKVIDMTTFVSPDSLQYQ